MKNKMTRKVKHMHPVKPKLNVERLPHGWKVDLPVDTPGFVAKFAERLRLDTMRLASVKREADDYKVISATYRRAYSSGCNDFYWGKVLGDDFSFTTRFHPDSLEYKAFELLNNVE